METSGQTSSPRMAQTAGTIGHGHGDRGLSGWTFARPGMRAAGLREGKVDHAANYQAQRVQLKFPKEHLFQIMVGPETYRRLSYVYQGKAFEKLQTTSGGAGMSARSDFHYAYIFGPDVLLMHWLALYLGLPAGFWLLRRVCPEGQALWVFGLVSFLVPAFFDFGPVHEREYFRWEFAAGFGFAGALAALLALQWNRDSKAWKALVVVMAILVTLGGERRINRTLLTIESLPTHKRERALKPWYPSPRDWILNSPELRMTEDMLEAALKLRLRSGPQDRMLTDIDVRKHWDIHQEATVVALAVYVRSGTSRHRPGCPMGMLRSLERLHGMLFGRPVTLAFYLFSIAAGFILCIRRMPSFWKKTRS